MSSCCDIRVTWYPFAKAALLSSSVMVSVGTGSPQNTHARLGLLALPHLSISQPSRPDMNWWSGVMPGVLEGSESQGFQLLTWICA